MYIVMVFFIGAIVGAVISGVGSAGQYNKGRKHAIYEENQKAYKNSHERENGMSAHLHYDDKGLSVPNRGSGVQKPMRICKSCHNHKVPLTDLPCTTCLQIGTDC